MFPRKNTKKITKLVNQQSIKYPITSSLEKCVNHLINKHLQQFSSYLQSSSLLLGSRTQADRFSKNYRKNNSLLDCPPFLPLSTRSRLNGKKWKIHKINTCYCIQHRTNNYQTEPRKKVCNWKINFLGTKKNPYFPSLIFLVLFMYFIILIHCNCYLV